MEFSFSKIRTFLFFSFFAAISVFCGGHLFSTIYTWNNSVTEGDWNVASNWNPEGIPGAADQVVVDGDASVTINITENVTVGETSPAISVNTAGSSAVTFNIAEGKTLSLNSMLMLNKSNGDGTYNSNVKFTGKGTVNTKSIDIPDTLTHTIDICDGVKLNIDGTLWADTRGSFVITSSDTTGVCEFMSNSKIELGASAVKTGLVIDTLKLTVIDPYDKAKATNYTIKIEENNFPTNPIYVTLAKSDGTEGAGLTFRYAVAIKSTSATFKIDGVPFTSGNYSLETNLPKEFIISGENLAEGDSIKITFGDPMGRILPGIINFTMGKITWTGAAGTKWEETSNWSGLTHATVKESVAGQDILIEKTNTGNYPVISDENSLKTLTVGPGTSVSMETGGKLVLEKLTCNGSGNFMATGGEVEFTVTDYCEFSREQAKFHSLTFSGSGEKLNLNNVPSISGDLYNKTNGTLVQIQKDFTAGGIIKSDSKGDFDFGNSGASDADVNIECEALDISGSVHFYGGTLTLNKENTASFIRGAQTRFISDANNSFKIKSSSSLLVNIENSVQPTGDISVSGGKLSLTGSGSSEIKAKNLNVTDSAALELKNIKFTSSPLSLETASLILENADFTAENPKAWDKIISSGISKIIFNKETASSNAVEISNLTVNPSGCLDIEGNGRGTFYLTNAFNNGNLNINATLTTLSGTFTNAAASKVDLKGSLSLNPSGTVEINGGKLEFTGDSSQSFTTNRTDFSTTSEIYFKNTDTSDSADGVVINSNLTAKKISLESGTLTFNASAKLTDYSATDSEPTNLSGIIKTSGAAAFRKPVVFNGKKVTGLSGFLCSSNVYIKNETSEPFEIDAKIFSTQNILAYSGKITVTGNGSLEAEKDLIILGPDYSVADSDSGITDLFSYANPNRDGINFAKVNFSGTFPSSNSATFTIENKSLSPSPALKCGGNFYANGTTFSTDTITGGERWHLAIGDTDDSSVRFAEIYNSKIKQCSASFVVAASENNNSGASSDNATNTNIEFFYPVLKAARTKYDDVVEVYFVQSDDDTKFCRLENSKGEIWKALGNISKKDDPNDASLTASSVTLSSGNYFSAYLDSDCTVQIPSDSDLDIEKIYLKSNVTWNTDATGITSGETESTDRQGTHKITKPEINILKASDSFYKTLMTTGKNRIRTTNFTGTTDECAPVLVKVASGTEKHDASPAVQKYSDAHNFIEARFSESVTFVVTDGDVTSTYVYDAVTENEKATSVFADIPNSSSGLEIKGLLKIQNGKLDAATSSLISLNSFFRKSAHALRFVAAGYVDGTVNLHGTTFKNWKGYINSAETPSGDVTRNKSEAVLIKDKAENASDESGTTNHPLKVLSVVSENSPGDDTTQDYKKWDTTRPGFAPYRSSVSGDYSSIWSNLKNAPEYETVGTAASYGQAFINKLELHIFDDEPEYDSSDLIQWYSQIGWCSPDVSSDIKSKTKDIYGGIRSCTLKDAQQSFKYSTDGGTPDSAFKNQDITQFTTSTLFLPAVDPSSGNVTAENDCAYIDLYLRDDTFIELKTKFVVSYDENISIITDLAGNRLRSKTFSSIDRGSPEFTMSVSPVGKKQLLVFVSKRLLETNFDFQKSKGSSEVVSTGGLAGIPKSLELINKAGGATASGLQIDDSVPAKIVLRSEKGTGFIVMLNQDVTLDDVKDCFLRVKDCGTAVDPLSGIEGTKISFILDEKGNYMPVEKASSAIGNAHAFSDFAVNVINPVYAYDTKDEVHSKGFYGGDDYSVRDFSGSGSNTNRILTNKDLLLQVSKISRIKGAPIFMSVKPDEQSVSNKLRENTGRDYKIWLPDLGSGFPVFRNLSESENTNFQKEESQEITGSDTLFNYEIKTATESEKYRDWKNGEKVSFVFGLTDESGTPLKISHYADSREYPLYALRLSDENDITSFDMWYVTLSDITRQRGNVTILNNVINAADREQTVVEVDVPKNEFLSVYVMTLDGNIIKRLEHSDVSAGLHYYRWDGTNNGGNTVARSMYFIRVISSSIDETRKVIVVK